MLPRRPSFAAISPESSSVVILEPIQQIIDCVINNVKNKKGNPKWKNMCKNLKIVLKNDEKELVTKKLLK
jgi:hypothetical protein